MTPTEVVRLLEHRLSPFERGNLRHRVGWHRDSWGDPTSLERAPHHEVMRLAAMLRDEVGDPLVGKLGEFERWLVLLAQHKLKTKGGADPSVLLQHIPAAVRAGVLDRLAIPRIGPMPEGFDFIEPSEPPETSPAQLLAGQMPYDSTFQVADGRTARTVRVIGKAQSLGPIYPNPRDGESAYFRVGTVKPAIRGSGDLVALYFRDAPGGRATVEVFVSGDSSGLAKPGAKFVGKANLEPTDYVRLGPAPEPGTVKWAEPVEAEEDGHEQIAVLLKDAWEVSVGDTTDQAVEDLVPKDLDRFFGALHGELDDPGSWIDEHPKFKSEEWQVRTVEAGAEWIRTMRPDLAEAVEAAEARVLKIISTEFEARRTRAEALAATLFDDLINNTHKAIHLYDEPEVARENIDRLAALLTAIDEDNDGVEVGAWVEQNTEDLEKRGVVERNRSEFVDALAAVSTDPYWVDIHAFREDLRRLDEGIPLWAAG